MNRRDIIIVAVLINAGLLVTLFVSSLKKEQNVDLASSPYPEVPTQIVEAAPLKEKDQVDQVISQYVAKAKEEESKKVELLPPSVLPATTKPQEKREPAPYHPLKVVTVEKGDVLEKIARSHGVSVDEIMKLNQLSNSRLQIGQELKLPQKKEGAKEKKLPQIKEEGKYYIVKGGDSPWTIAQKNGIQVEELLKLNHLDKEKAKRLQPGDRLKIQ